MTVGREPDSAIELWELSAGQRVVVCYSTFTALAASCGTGQPFRRLDPTELAEVCEVSRAQALLDEVLPVPPRYPELDTAEQPDLPLLDEATDEPELLYIPSRPTKPGADVVAIELQLHRRRPTLLAFTTAQALEAGCGPHQPYVAVPAELLETVMAESSAERVLFNPVLAEESRHTAPLLDWSSKSVMGRGWRA
ncbi:SAV_915 family protein [Prauserella cavernicola]|uniref:SseB protein N-terminal domain-containing protein n=1 Tax=Prauserella cavernicola TaxID=2800127 RepID=A0A934QQN4_9PSEU|nr:SAV_915 family protein [Prauserella cavernicola]MBK1784427.1 hypothetical protein [Prauserella cavernicola]